MKNNRIRVLIVTLHNNRYIWNTCYLLGLVAFYALRRINDYENIILNINNTVESIKLQLKKIDDKGTFESDDEVGFFFTEIKRLGNELNSLFETEVEDAPIKEKRKKKSKIYFGTPVHDAIVRYNQSDKPSERNKIYTEEIHKAFLKLAENIINTFKFSYFSYGFRDLQEEVVSNLVINMHKFDETKGSKAFSYFSVVAKNYLILNNNANYKKVKIHDDVDTLYTQGVDDEVIEKSPSSDIFKKTMEYFEENIERLFPKPADRDIAESILYLCKNKDNIDNFNKKAIYIMIREMTDVKTSKITQVTNTFRKIYPRIQEEVLSRGHIDNLRYTGSLV